MAAISRYAPGRARRESIVAEATKLYARVGYNGATTMALAAQCGISRAGLLHHFPTRESLLLAVLEDRDRLEAERFRISGSAASDGLGVLRGMVELVEFNSTQFGIIQLYAVLSAEATSPDHPAHEYFVARYERIRSGTQWALARARDAGWLINGADVGALTVELTSLIDGLQLQWLLAPDRVDMADQLRRRIQQLVTVPLWPEKR